MKEYVARFGQGNSKMAKQAQSKEKVLEKMQRGGLTEKVEVEKALDFKFPDPGKLSPPVLQCNELAFGYPGCDVLYEGVDLGVDLESRVALVGPNGAGKSTLLKILTGDLLPLVGSIRPHAHLRISKFSQHFIDVLDLEMNPIDYFMDLWKDLTLPEARKFLGRFGVTGQVQTTKMDHLSDGQKSRVVLAKMAGEKPHILFLDEPTNHLDMESIDSLARAINDFNGGMVLVSHDMRLISQVAKEIWICDNRTVSRYCGEIHDFKMHLRRTLAIDGDSAKVAPLPTVPLSCKSLGGEKPLVPTKAPPLPSKAPSSASTSSGRTEEEEAIMKARMELADLAIAKQRARKAAEAGASDGVEISEDGDNDDDEQPEVPANDAKKVKPPKAEIELKYDDDGNMIFPEGMSDREIKKAKKRAEKEAARILEIREEEERKARRVANQNLFEDAAKFKVEQAELKAEAEKKKAEIEKAKRDKAEAEAAAIAAAKAKRKEERAARRAIKQTARAEAMAKAKEAMDAAVVADYWTQEQQNMFEIALLDNPGGPRIDKTERWRAISNCTEGKTMNQCIMRYRYLKEYVAKRREIEHTL